MAITKTIKSARPTVDTASGNVLSWNVEITFKDGNFERDYSYAKDVSDLNKAPSAFTQADVLGYAPAVLDEVFAHHKEVSAEGYTPPTEVINDFEFASE
jgi:hypothetical protein